MPPEASKPKSPPWKWLILGLVLVGVLVVSRGFPVRESIQAGLDWIASLGHWAPILFILLYIVATVLALPGSPLTLGAGALFGVAWGSVYVSIGSTLGATAAFLVGRYLARDAVVRRIEGNARFAEIDRAVAREGWKIVILTRLSPVFPFALLNYAFGITQVRLRHYVLASWAGMLPATVLYVYLGSLAQVATTQRTRSPGEWMLYAIGLLSTLGVTWYVTRIARQSLRRAIPTEPSLTAQGPSR